MTFLKARPKLISETITIRIIGSNGRASHYTAYDVDFNTLEGLCIGNIEKHMPEAFDRSKRRYSSGGVKRKELNN
jgi:hypothetical protein